MSLYRPMLAGTSTAPFDSEDWIFEVKWDGIRAISHIDQELSIRSRNKKELRKNFPELEELRKLAKDMVIDGEIVLLADGHPDFHKLVERANSTSPKDINFMAKKYPVTYVVFDILERDGISLIDIPLIERKKVLSEALREGKYVTQSVYVEDAGKDYFEAAIRKGMEGVLAKMKDSRYLPGRRSNQWLKIKTVLSCDCVIFGYTTGEGRRGFGALILGLYDGERPIYVGKVGTGFSASEIKSLRSLFKKHETERKTIEGVKEREEVTWLKPALVAEIGYQTITKDGKLRMPRYQGLRADKTPADCKIGQIKRHPLGEYAGKRDFSKTPEPRGKVKEAVGKSFVVHEHNARRLHYDLRLEKEGVLKSWAVPKGPPKNPGDKRLAIQTEDHPIEYGRFEGTIPEGQYGAGTVKIWDTGLYEPLEWSDDKVEFLIMGDRLKGRYELVRFRKAGEKEWLFLKARE